MHCAARLCGAAEAEGAVRPVGVLLTPRAVEHPRQPDRQPAHGPEARHSSAQLRSDSVADRLAESEVHLDEGARVAQGEGGVLLQTRSQSVSQ